MLDRNTGSLTGSRRSRVGSMPRPLQGLGRQRRGERMPIPWFGRAEPSAIHSIPSQLCHRERWVSCHTGVGQLRTPYGQHRQRLTVLLQSHLRLGANSHRLATRAFFRRTRSARPVLGQNTVEATGKDCTRTLAQRQADGHWQYTDSPLPTVLPRHAERCVPFSIPVAVNDPVAALASKPRCRQYTGENARHPALVDICSPQRMQRIDAWLATLQDRYDAPEGSNILRWIGSIRTATIVLQSVFRS